jgi:hypothetical protein
MVKVNSSRAAVFDASGEGGQQYVILALDVRSYVGEHAGEPMTDPDFEFMKEYGNRKGFSETLACTSASPTGPGLRPVRHLLRRDSGREGRRPVVELPALPAPVP